MEITESGRNSILLVAAIVAVPILFLLIRNHMRRKRREAMLRYARMHGYLFMPELSWAWTEAAEGFRDKIRKELGPGGEEAIRSFMEGFALTRQSAPLLGEGRSFGFTNIIYRTSGEGGTAVFDYSYTVGSGKNSRSYVQTVALFRDMGVPWPEFQASPENFAHKLVSLFGYQDIDFDDSPDFSGRYLLRGPDESGIRMLFDRGLRDILSAHKGISVQTRGKALLVFRHGRRVSPRSIDEFIHVASGIHIEFVRSSER